MDIRFYRSGDTKRWLKSIAKSASSNKRRTGLVLAATFVLLYLTFDNKGLVARIRLEMKQKEMAENVREAEHQMQALKAQIKALEGDKKTIETIAREKYGMTRPGEKLYRVQKQAAQ